jgi:two-component system response regulator YesN
MIKMPIVDDDTFELDCIKTFIDWELIGVQIIGEAVNGSQGLMKVMELSPDITRSVQYLKSVGY